MTYILTLEEKGQFKKSRQAGATLGSHHGNRHQVNKTPGITHAGDRYLRTLLVECAHRVMRGTDCDLRRFGERLTARGGRTGKSGLSSPSPENSPSSCTTSGSAGKCTNPLRSESSAPMAA
ncbi:MAG: hypothetical protein U0837_00220 [Dehalococcoidia bacterium]